MAPSATAANRTLDLRRKDAFRGRIGSGSGLNRPLRADAISMVHLSARCFQTLSDWIARTEIPECGAEIGSGSGMAVHAEAIGTPGMSAQPGSSNGR